MLGAAGAMFGAWAALVGDFARRRGWGPRFCQLSTMPFLVLGLAACAAGVMSDEIPTWAVCLATSSGVAGMFCRKFAYPGKERPPSVR
jgi:hypothetical protein